MVNVRRVDGYVVVDSLDGSLGGRVELFPTKAEAYQRAEQLLTRGGPMDTRSTPAYVFKATQFARE